MYERFFQLRERPFALSPDPDYLYPSRVHREALGYLRYGIESQAGFVVITGEIGSGKTTLLQALLRGLDGRTTVVRLMNTLLTPRELLESIALELGIDAAGTSKPALLHALAARLVEERRAERLVLVVIDEAQNLGLDALEELRMLSNLETEKSKLVQLVLVGQPDLRSKLNQPSLVQLRQRITVSYHLGALDAEETAAYINHRLRRAAIGAPLQLARSVTDHVHQRAHGVPRLINVVCDAVLVFAYAEERRTIDASLVDEAVGELEATGVLLPEAAGAAAEPATPTAASDSQATPAAADARIENEHLEVAHALVEKEAVLRAREEQVARAEQQLAEQRHVLAEEYQLFRTREAREFARAPVAAAPSPRPAWPPTAAPAAGPAHAASDTAPAPSSYSSAARRIAGDREPADEVAIRERPIATAPQKGQVVPFTAGAWAEASPRRGFWRRMRRLLSGSERVSP